MKIRNVNKMSIINEIKINKIKNNYYLIEYTWMKII